MRWIDVNAIFRCGCRWWHNDCLSGCGRSPSHCSSEIAQWPVATIVNYMKIIGIYTLIRWSLHYLHATKQALVCLHRVAESLDRWNRLLQVVACYFSTLGGVLSYDRRSVDGIHPAVSKFWGRELEEGTCQCPSKALKIISLHTF